MKKLFVLMLTLVISPVFYLSGQIITCGQTNGQGIVYNDIENIELHVENFSWTDGYTFDIDGNSVDDFILNLYYYWFSHLNIMGTRVWITPLASCEVSVTGFNAEWAEKHLWGDTIKAGLNWSSAESVLHNAESSGSAGIFTGDGYIGFRLNDPGNTVGWIYLNVLNSYDYANVTVYSYAYCQGVTGIFPLCRDDIRITNPVNDILSVDLPCSGFPNVSNFKISDVSGKIMLQAILNQGINQLNVEWLEPGLYFLTIISENKQIVSDKIIKF